MFVQRTKIGLKHSMAPVFKNLFMYRDVYFKMAWICCPTEEFHEPVMDYPDGKWLAHIWI